MGLPLCFLPAPNSYSLPKSIDIEVGWPTSLTGGRGQVAVTLGLERVK